MLLVAQKQVFTSQAGCTAVCAVWPWCGATCVVGGVWLAGCATQEGAWVFGLEHEGVYVWR